jgi:hypothetical protein
VVAAVITAGVVLVAALAWLAGTARAEAAGSGPPANAVYHSLRSVVVQPGESLWAIAEQADPAGDPRSVMQEIIDINALRGHVGPARSAPVAAARLPPSPPRGHATAPGARTVPGMPTVPAHRVGRRHRRMAES